MQIELYSVGGYTGNGLREMLEKALALNHLPYEVWEITNIKRFIQLRLPAVPAIKVGDKIFVHPSGGSTEDTVDRVIEYLKGTASPSILVPLDFSDESMHALDYACMIGDQLGYGITLTHIHQPVLDPMTGGACDVLMQQENQRQMEDMANIFRARRQADGNHLPVEVHIESGDTASSLIQLSLHDDHFKMIIMCTKAKDNVVRRLLGTVSNRVARQSAKPVMIIPPNASIRFPQRWTIGLDKALLESKSLNHLLRYHDQMHISMMFTHIVTNSGSDDLKDIDSLKQKLDAHPNGVAELNYQYMAANGLSIDTALFNKAENDRADVLVLFSQHRSFLESIQHSSVIRKAIQQPRIPVLIFPLQAAQA